MLSFKNIKLNNVNSAFSDVILFCSLLFVGGFNEYISCIISIALLVYLFVKTRKNHHFKIILNWYSVSIISMVLFYGLTVFWAVDSGMAFIGFLKFLPVLLYILVLNQTNQTQRALQVLPYFVVLLVCLSAIGSLIPGIQNWFLVAERFAGVFQYPNTFAMLILIAELLLLKKNQWKIVDFIAVIVLIGGLLYTGSRAVFLLFLIANFLMILTKFSGKQRLIVLAIASTVVAILSAIAFFGPDGNLLGRFVKIGLKQSTFVGRFLYMQDALPLLLKYPFGMGFSGYFYSQGAVQTGVYSVSFVHNDILQIALDVGIIPAILFVISIVRYFLKKNVPFADKLVVIVFTLHNLFDFNLQFVGMFMLYVLLMCDNHGKEICITNTVILKVMMSLFLMLNVYMSIPLVLSQFTSYETAHKLYPYNTRNALSLLEQQVDIDSANEIAEEILKYNKAYYAPYSIRSKYAYSQGDFLSVINNKNEVFDRIRFEYKEYEEYGVMLVNGINAYNKMGDSQSARFLREELKNLKNQMENSNQQLSVLGSMINDQPVTQLPDEILKFLDSSDK